MSDEWFPNVPVILLSAPQQVEPRGVARPSDRQVRHSARNAVVAMSSRYRIYLGLVAFR